MKLQTEEAYYNGKLALNVETWICISPLQNNQKHLTNLAYHTILETKAGIWFGVDIGN